MAHKESSDAPFALIRAEQGRLLLAAVDAAAAAVGLAPGLPLADARAILPGLRTAEAEPEADLRALTRLAEWCGRYTPWAALDGTVGDAGGGAGLLLDVTGCAHLFGGEAALLADLLVRVGRLGYAARAALAETPGAAWALARFAAPSQGAGEPVLVLPGEVRPALAPLPPTALRLPPEQDELLARLGLTSIGDLFDVPPASLASRFGPLLARRLAQALGAAPEPISPQAPPPPFLARRVLAEPIVTAEAIAKALERLAAALCRQLEAEQQGARRLVLTLYRVDGTLRRLALGTSRPNRDPAHLLRLFAGHIERIDPGFGIEVMTLAASAAESQSALQLSLGTAQAGQAGLAPGRAAGELAELLDRLESRLGPGSVCALAPQESHLPERAVRLRAPLAAGSGAARWDREAWQPWRDVVLRPLRPLRLLSRPEPIEAIALLPDHPPAQFRWRRLRHRIVRAEGPERLAQEWWRVTDIAAPRDYFRIEDEDGRRFWLYRAGSQWFLQGLFG